MGVEVLADFSSGIEGDCEVRLCRDVVDCRLTRPCVAPRVSEERVLYRPEGYRWY